MRIISGEWRSRVLRAPAGMATRPTSDRLRETLFNVLAPEIRGARFADLFAGSGAVGLEALSRGAAHCTFVEKARPALAALRQNLDSLGVEVSRYTVLTGDAGVELLRAESPTWDIVFLDPPYEDAEAYIRSVQALARPGLLAEQALLVLEHAAPKSRRGAGEIPDSLAGFERDRLLVQGDAALSFYRMPHKGNP